MPIFCFSSIIRTKRLGKDRNLLQTFLVHLFVKLQSLSKTRVFSEHWVVLQSKSINYFFNWDFLRKRHTNIFLCCLKIMSLWGNGLDLQFSPFCSLKKLFIFRMILICFHCHSIDASTSARICKYVNDTSSKYANCEMRIVECNNKAHLCLFAKRNIIDGEELRYIYLTFS